MGIVPRKRASSASRFRLAIAVGAVVGGVALHSPFAAAADIPNGGTLTLTGTANTSGLATQVYNITPPGTVTGFNNGTFLLTNSNFNGAAAATGTGNASVFYGTSTTADPGNGQTFATNPTNYGITLGSNFFARFSGYFNATTTGSYTFGLDSDDGSVLYIDGQQVVNLNGYRGESGAVAATGMITLTAGLHEIVEGLYQGGGGAGITTYYNPPGGTGLAPIPITDASMNQILTGPQALADFTATATPSVNVPAGNSGTLNVQYALTAKFNALTLNGNGVSTNSGMTIQGAAVQFNTTTFAGGGTVTLAPSAASAFSQDISFGVASDSGTAVSIVKTGYNAILLDNAATGAGANSFVSGTSFNIQGGSLVVNGTNGGSNPLSQASVILSAPTGNGGAALQNSTLTLSSQAGAVTIDSPVSLAANATANIIAQQANEPTTGGAPQVGVSGIATASVGNVTITLGGVNSLNVPGGSTLNLSSNDGDTLALGAPFTLLTNGNLNAVGGTVNLAGGTVSGTLANAGATLNINTTPLAGAGTINVTSGTANVNIANPGFTGAVNLSGGVMNENTVSALAASSAININSGGTLNVNAADSNSANVVVNSGGIFELSKDQGGASPGTVPTTAIAGTVQVNANQSAGYNLALNGGTIEAVNGGQSFGSNISLAGSVTFGGAGQSLTDTGNITGNGNFVKAGTETVTLSGTNSYSGATSVTNGTLLLNSPIVSTTDSIVGGTLKLGVAGALPSTSVATVNGTLDLNGQSQMLAGLSGGGLITSSGLAPVTLTVSGTNSFGGTITDGGAAGKALSLAVPTGSTLTLTGGGTFVGGTTIPTGARVNANASTVLGTGVVSLNGGTLSLGGQSGGSPIYITGFGPGNALSTASNFKLNGSAAFASPGVLRLTDGNGGEAGSAFFNTQQNLANLSNATGFAANFTYQMSGANPADGAAFVLQNSAGGSSALGNSGGGLGYGGIANSAALEINIFSNNTVGIATRTAGVTGAPYNATGSVNVASGDPIAFSLNYDGLARVLTETLTDTTTSATYTTTASINIASAIGGTAFYVGFTGGTGGQSATQTITNFTLSSGVNSSNTASIANTINVTSTSTLESNIPATGSVATVGPVNFASNSTLNITPGASIGAGNYNVVTGVVTLAGPATVNVANNGPSLGITTFVGIGDNGSNYPLTKNGPGALLISSTNSYGGSILAKQGILGGNGAITGGIQISSGAALAPSALLTIAAGGASLFQTGSISMPTGTTSGAILGASLAKPDNGMSSGGGTNAGVDYDEVRYTGTFVLTNATLSINDNAYAANSPKKGDQFFIVDSSLFNGNAVNATFSNLSGNVYTSSNGITYSVLLNQPGDPTGNSQDILLTVQSVPEPGAIGLLSLAAGGMLIRRRRRLAL